MTLKAIPERQLSRLEYFRSTPLGGTIGGYPLLVTVILSEYGDLESMSPIRK